MEVAFIVNVMSESGENVNLGNPVKEANQENQVNWLKMSIIGQHQNTNKEDFLLSHWHNFSALFLPCLRWQLMIMPLLWSWLLSQFCSLKWISFYLFWSSVIVWHLSFTGQCRQWKGFGMGVSEKSKRLKLLIWCQLHVCFKLFQLTPLPPGQLTESGQKTVLCKLWIKNLLGWTSWPSRGTTNSTEKGRANFFFFTFVIKLVSYWVTGFSNTSLSLFAVCPKCSQSVLRVCSRWYQSNLCRWVKLLSKQAIL